MKKKNYLLSLDEDKVEELKTWLEKNNISFSGYVNSTIEEQLEALKLFAPNGDYTKITTKSLLKMASKMVKELKR